MNRVHERVHNKVQQSLWRFRVGKRKFRSNSFGSYDQLAVLVSNIVTEGGPAQT